VTVRAAEPELPKATLEDLNAKIKQPKPTVAAEPVGEDPNDDIF
jgi:hypothetical protein